MKTLNIDPPPTPAPDEDRVFALLRKTGLGERDALRLLLEIRDMASANLIARFLAQLEASRAESRAELRSLRSELTVQRWMMGLGFAALVAAAIAQLFRSGG